MRYHPQRKIEPSPALPVGVFVPEGPDDHVKSLHAFAAGLGKAGVPHFLSPLANGYEACSVAVTFGVGKPGVPVSQPRGRILQQHMFRDLPFIVLEKGFVLRDKYFHVAWNGLNGRGNFCAPPSDPGPDRWRALHQWFSEWVGSIHAPTDDGKTVLVCGQVPWDATVSGTDHLLWCQEVAAYLQNEGMRVLFRPHPLADIDYGVQAKTDPNAFLEDTLQEVHAVVTFNSSTAAKAILRGFPTVAMDPGSIIWGVHSTLDQICSGELIPEPDRKTWAHRLAHKQWNLEELASGACWVQLSQYLDTENQRPTPDVCP